MGGGCVGYSDTALYLGDLEVDFVRRREMKVVGYIRVSTSEQVDSGAGLEAQRAAIENECRRRGWELSEVCEDLGFSGKTVDGRVGLERALSLVRTRAVEGIMVANLDRLSRSLVDFARLMSDAQREKWNLVALDLGVDLSTPAGEFLANVLASAAQWERRIISQRTRDALAVKRASGTRIGRPLSVVPEVREQIRERRRSGWCFRRIAGELNERRVPTARGGNCWYPSTVRAICRPV